MRDIFAHKNDCTVKSFQSQVAFLQGDWHKGKCKILTRVTRIIIIRAIIEASLGTKCIIGHNFKSCLSVTF